MPKQNSHYEFKDFDKILPVPYCMYIDIEALLEKQETPTSTKTRKLQKHSPIAIGTLIIPSNDLKATPIKTSNKYKSFIGVDCIREFRNYLIETCKDIYDWTKINSHTLANRGRAEDIQAFNDADKCQQCKRSFQNDKVWHHNHNNGEFIGALCSTCNLKIEQSRRSLTIVCHNLKNYDLHHILLNGFCEDKRIKLKPIAQTSEKYLSLLASYYFPIESSWSHEVKSINKKKAIRFDMRFIDSCAFMSSSLASLTKTLPTSDLVNTLKMQSDYKNLSVTTISEKGIFPYSYFDSIDKMHEVALPPKSSFFDTLSQDELSDRDYDLATTAWNELRMQNIGRVHGEILGAGCAPFGRYF